MPDVTFRNWEDGTDNTIALPKRRNPSDSTFHGVFSADSRLFAAGGGWNEALCIYEIASGREINRFQCHAWTSTFSPDGKQLAVASMKNDKGESEAVLRFFSVVTGREEKQCPMGHSDSIFHLSYSPDGKTLACGRSDRACFFDCETGKVRHELSDLLWFPYFTPDGKTAVLRGHNCIRIWDVATGRQHEERPDDIGSSVMAPSPDGNMLAIGTWYNRFVYVWDLKSSQVVQQLPQSRRYLCNLVYSQDGKSIRAAYKDGRGIRSWNTANGTVVRDVELKEPGKEYSEFGDMYLVHVSADGKQACTLERQVQGDEKPARLLLWNVDSGSIINQHTVPMKNKSCAWLADGRAAILAKDESMAVIDVTTAKARARFDIPSSASRFRTSPDERLLVVQKTLPNVGGEEIMIGVWEIATGKPVATLTTGHVDGFCLASDNRTLVTADRTFIRIWDVATGNERKRWPLPESVSDSSKRVGVSRLQITPDDRRVIAAMRDGTILVWDLTAIGPAEPLMKDADEKAFRALFADIADGDAARAYAAIWRLVGLPPNLVVSRIAKELKLAVAPDAVIVRRLIADLDSNDFETRSKASKHLESFGDAIFSALRLALEQKPSAEVRRRLESLLAQSPDVPRSPDDLRAIRGIQVLELAGTTEARQLLAELAKGDPATRLTQEAKASFARLEHRP